MNLSLTEMQKEVFEWALTKGWEPNPDRPFADACSLMHSEVSEMLEAYRIWRFDDATDAARIPDDQGNYPDGLPKPEGVASEVADVLIRLVHYCEAYGIMIDPDYPVPEFRESITFGTECALMHASISGAYVVWEFEDRAEVDMYLSRLYALLRYCCQVHDFDLAAEYRRKMDYNATREHLHGGRAM